MIFSPRICSKRARVSIFFAFSHLSLLPEPQTLCEICADPITICYDPFSESKKGAASSGTSLGMILTPCRHEICHDDLVRHIDIKLEDAKSGQKKAFPMVSQPVL